MASFNVTNLQIHSNLSSNANANVKVDNSFYLSLLQRILTTRFVTDKTTGKSNKFLFGEKQSDAVKILCNICSEAEKRFKEDVVFLRLPGKAPTIIIGDLHGQIHDLQRILFDIKIDPIKNRYLFLGDLVDRGDWSIEVATIIFLMKILFPKNVFVLRGNHECPLVNNIYGFQQECCRTFSEKTAQGDVYGMVVWGCFNSSFQYLPLCALLQEKIFCTHGGISPHLDKLDDLDFIDRNSLATIPDDGIVCDLTWADPEENTSDTGYTDNERGCSVVFNSKVAKEFCEKFGLYFICRAHQMVDNGFEFFADKHLITVFSASNYCGDGENTGAVLCVLPEEPLSSTSPHHIHPKQPSLPFYCSFVSFPVISNVSDVSLRSLPFMTASGKDFFVSLNSIENQEDSIINCVNKNKGVVEHRKKTQRSPSPLPYRPSSPSPRSTTIGGQTGSVNRSQSTSTFTRLSNQQPVVAVRSLSTPKIPTRSSVENTINNIKVVRINTSLSLG